MAVINEYENGRTEEGYLGATAWRGNKSNQHLYGADLSKAIREDLKKAGIKGITVSCETYSMGQSIHFTVKAKNEDFISKKEYVEKFSMADLGNWMLDTNNELIHSDKFFDMTSEQQKAILKHNAEASYNNARTQNIQINNIDRYSCFTEDFKSKIRMATGIADSYRYDDSNSMVDYFDTNFYYDFTVKPVEPYIDHGDMEDDIDAFIDSFDSDITGNTSQIQTNDQPEH